MTGHPKAFHENFTGSVAESYDRFLGETFFAPFAQDIAQRAAKFAPRRILECAAGTGIVTHALAMALPDAEILATDLNAPMLEQAKQKTNAFGNVQFAQADAQKMQLGDGAFDLVIHQFGIMFFPDRKAHYREARRLLTPNGHLLFSTYDSLEFNDCPRLAEEALVKLYPENPPRVISQFPHGYWDRQLITSEVGSAGFGSVAINTVEKTCVAPDAFWIAQGLCLGTPVRGEIMARNPAGMDQAIDAVAQRIAEALGGQQINGRMKGLVVTAS